MSLETWIIREINKMHEGGKMIFENICISLEMAKKLKENGIECKSCFYWVNARCEDESYRYVLAVLKQCGYSEILSDNHITDIKEIYPAPTLQEFLKLLPFEIQESGSLRVKYYLMIERLSAEYFRVKYISDSGVSIGRIDVDEDLKIALSETLIWLKQNNYLKPEYSKPEE